jgi:serpin B
VRRLTVSLAMLALLISACGEAPDPPVQHVSMKLTDSSSGFGLNLLDHLLAEPKADNVFISPLSATLMLSMAASAAHGETQAAMLQTLGLDPTIDPSSEARQTIERLAQSDDNAQLELAQSVWAQQGLKLNPAYVTKLRRDYGAQLASVDFTSPDAPRVVNRWVDGATHHKIPQLVDNFDPSIVGYIVNATYFHALWRIEFKSAPRGDFRTFSGATASVPMMKRDESVIQLYTPDYTAALLPYKGGRFSAVLLVPRKVLSPSDFASLLTQANWNAAMGYLHSATGSSLGGRCKRWDTARPNIGLECYGTLVMPKFKLDYKKDLTEKLRAMGMPLPDASLPEFCDGCALTKVVQKTYLEVDEKGTTAAAATGGAVAVSAHIPLIVDHPFALALIDNATDAPLFLGVIGNL